MQPLNNALDLTNKMKNSYAKELKELKKQKNMNLCAVCGSDDSSDMSAISESSETDYSPNPTPSQQYALSETASQESDQLKERCFCHKTTRPFDMVGVMTLLTCLSYQRVQRRTTPQTQPPANSLLCLRQQARSLTNYPTPAPARAFLTHNEKAFKIRHWLDLDKGLCYLAYCKRWI